MDQPVRRKFIMINLHRFTSMNQMILFFIFRNMRRTRIEIIVLHSMSDSQQRNLAFRKPEPKTRKIILATNIAESSITVPDVKYGKFHSTAL